MQLRIIKATRIPNRLSSTLEFLAQILEGVFPMNATVALAGTISAILCHRMINLLSVVIEGVVHAIWQGWGSDRQAEEAI